MEKLLPFLTEVKPTIRLLFIALIPALLLALGSFFAFAYLLIPFSIFFVGYLCWADWRKTSNEAGFTFFREHHAKMAIGTFYTVELHVQNLTINPVDLEIEDATPPRFERKSSRRNGRVQSLQAHIPPSHNHIFRYQIRPTYRGDYALHEIKIRWISHYGLFNRSATIELPTRIKVYPNLLKIRQETKLLKPGQRIETGIRTARNIGGTGEFEQLREYLPDDDYRRISWQATARYGKPITMEYTPERSQNILLTIDISRKMMTRPLGVARTTRLDLIINAVLFFSYVALARGDRVGILTFSNKVQKFVAPRSGTTQLSVIIEALYNVRAQPVDPDYAQALRYLHAQRQRRSLILLLTDPHKDDAIHTLVPYLSSFYPHHLPMCVTLSDPNVISAAQRQPYSLDSVYQRAVAEQIMDERRYWRNLLEQRGVMTMEVPAYHLTSAVINKYLEIKDKARI